MQRTRISICPWPVLVCLGATTLAAASPPAALSWHAADGRSFEGVFLGSTPDEAKAAFAGPAGIRLAVDSAQLTAAERTRLDDLTRSGAAARAAALAAPFRPASSPERTKLPLLNQEEFGVLANDCVPNAFAAFLLWWDQQGVLAVPHRGDARSKADWLHQRLSEYCATTEAAGTSTSDARRGLSTYFQRHLAGTAALRIGSDYDCTPANLARYPVGLAACLLNLTVYHGNTKQGGHFVALLNAKPDGTLGFRTWGLDFQGKLRVLPPPPATPDRGPRQAPAITREIDITNAARLPTWFRQLRIRFVLDPAEWNGLTVAVPYIYQKQPGSAPAPPDPLFDGLAPGPEHSH
ncbi:MAG: hypothetical protein NTW21_04715 [Verrucomicrobia bacterium]|nr:hypothetical protein [Verrucomicrobiota bacterium]